MRKIFVAITTLAMALVMSMSSLFGCKLITTNTERDMNQIVATVQIAPSAPKETIYKKDVMVEYYGAATPVSQVASVTVPDAKTVIIQPWEKNLIRAIEKAIIDSNIGLAPSNNGEQIRLTMPPLTEDRRKQLVKQVRGSAENARVTLRNIRRDAVDAFKKAQKDGMPEDEAKAGEGEAQKVIDKYSKKLDAMLDAKEKEIMTV